MLNIDLQNIPGEIIFIDEKQTKLSKTHLLPNLDILKNDFLFTSQFSLKKLDKEIYTTLYKTVNKKEYLQNMIQVCSFESRNKPIYKAFDQIKQMADQNGMHIFEQYLLKKIQEVKLINRELMW